MTFKIGDRVKVNPDSDEEYCVGSDNIGTITDVGESGAWYIIDWDNEGKCTYEDGNNKHQYNYALEDLLEANSPPLTTRDKVIRKIKYLEDKFNSRKAKTIVVEGEDDDTVVISWD